MFCLIKVLINKHKHDCAFKDMRPFATYIKSIFSYTECDLKISPGRTAGFD